MPAAKVLSTVRKVVPIRLRDEESGQVQDYAIKELDGHLKDQYTNETNKRMTLNAKTGEMKTGESQGMNAKFISLHLHDAVLEDVMGPDPDNPDAEHIVIDTIVKSVGAKVPENVIQAWPSSTQIELNAICREIDGLTDDEEEKKEQSKN